MNTKFTHLLIYFLFLSAFASKAQKANTNKTSLFLTVSADLDCNGTISERETRINNFTATIQNGDFSSTLSSGNNSNVVFSNLIEGTYSIKVVYTTNGKNYTQNFSTNIEKDLTNNYRPIVNVHCNDKETPEEIVKPACGKWFDADMDINDVSLIKGDLTITNKEIIIAKSNAKFNVNLDYRISYLQGKKEFTEQCKINYKVRYPNGRVINFEDNFEITITDAGLYTIEYSVNCNGNNCTSGVKYIRAEVTNREPKIENKNTSLSLTVSADLDCNGQITERETRISNFTATLQKGSFTSTLSSGRNSNITFNNLSEGLYTVKITYTINGKNYTQSFTTTLEKEMTNNYRPIVNIHCTEIKEIPKDTTEIVVKPKCGKWFDAIIDINNFNLAKGDLDIRSNDVILARLKAKLDVDLDYRISYIQNKKEVTEKCTISYKVRYPNGTVKNYNGNFDLAIMEPGIYTIEYFVNCNDNNCATGVKYIRCDEQIVCNCGPQNDLLSITVRTSKNTTYQITQKDTIIYNLSNKTWINHTTNCEGNICEGRSSYVIKHARGITVKTGNFIGRFKPDLLKDQVYLLEVTDYCGNKNCYTYKYPIRVIDSGRIETHGRFRVGIHADAHLNVPDFDNLSTSKVTVNGMVGFIGDLKIGANQNFHVWPSLNLVWYRYSGSNSSGLGDFSTKYKNIALELGLDISYVLYRKKEAALHIYGGGALDFEFLRKEQFTGSASAITAWKNAEKPTVISNSNVKGSIGLLYEINKKWMLGMNYFHYFVDKRADMLLVGDNQGAALRLAYFFNRK